MRYVLMGGGLMLLALACGAPDAEPGAQAPVPEAEPEDPAPAPGKAGKRRKDKAASGTPTCDAYCARAESCSHTEGWEYEADECAANCAAIERGPNGDAMVACFVNAVDCIDAAHCGGG